MSLSSVPSSERIHIGFFGMRNAGKSSLVNAVTGQMISVVSDVKGTTTDPVKKAMELLPLGPVVIIDTPGMDDEGELGAMRVSRARQMLSLCHAAVLVIDAAAGIRTEDEQLLEEIRARKLAHIVAFNKADLMDQDMELPDGAMRVSAATGDGIDALKERLSQLKGSMRSDKRIVSDLINPGDLVVLVTPVDESAPKGRLILPQQQTIRDLIDHHAAALVCQPQELRQMLSCLGRKPKMVITDSQAFEGVAGDVPEDIPLTSFSILFARYKGSLERLVRGASALSKLDDGDRVLIAEGCTHRRQCGDIGSVKIPGWISRFTGKKLEYAFCSGGEFPQDLSGYALIVHCGGCMLNEVEMGSRMRSAADSGIPMVNYGVAIAHIHGILKRSIAIFPDALKLLD